MFLKCIGSKSGASPLLLPSSQRKRFEHKRSRYNDYQAKKTITKIAFLLGAP